MARRRHARPARRRVEPGRGRLRRRLARLPLFLDKPRLRGVGSGAADGRHVGEDDAQDMRVETRGSGDGIFAGDIGAGRDVDQDALHRIRASGGGRLKPRKCPHPDPPRHASRAGRATDGCVLEL